MAAPAAVIVVMVAIMSVLAVIWTILYVVARVKRMRTGIAAARDRLEPAIAQLQTDAEVARAELERVQQAAEELRR